MVEARGAQPVGVGDPHPVLDRAAPDPHRDRRQRLRRALRAAAPGRRARRARPSRSRSPPPARASSSEPARAPIAAASAPTSAASCGGAARPPRGAARGPAAARRAAPPRAAAPPRRSGRGRGGARARTSRPAPARRPRGRAGSAAGRSARPVPSSASSRAISAAADRGGRRPGPRPRARSGCRRTRAPRRSAGRAAPGRGRRSRSAPGRRPPASRRATSARDRLGLAALAGGAQEDEALVGRLARSASIGAEAALEVEEERRVGVGGVGRGLLDRVDADLARALSSSGALRALERRVALLVGERDGHLGDRGAAPRIRSSWLRRQVVEAVEEDRPSARTRRPRRSSAIASRAMPWVSTGRARRAPRRSRRTGRRCRRGRRSPRASRPPPRRRPARGPRPAARRAGARAPAAKPGCGAEPRSGPSSRRRSATAAATAPGAGPGSARRPAARRRAVATVAEEAAEGHHRPPSTAPPAQSSRSKAKTSSRVGTTRTGSRSSTALKRAPDQAGAAGVRGSVDQLQRHRRLSSIGRPAARPDAANCGDPRPALPSPALSKLIRRWLSAS